MGSLPNSIDDYTLRSEFSKYGMVEDVFVKPNCEAGRQWAFITFQTAEQANLAKDSCDRILQFPGTDRPCDVMLAKNQGMFGQEPLGGQSQGLVPSSFDGPKKIFVGSLPDGCQEMQLRNEFSRYGTIEEVFLKPNCEPGRQWAFVSFAYHEQAAAAAAAANGILHFPGCIKACEVTLARNQGMYGQNPVDGVGSAKRPSSSGDYAYAAPVNPNGLAGARKIFVGSLPDQISESALRAEFSKYGQITDVHLKTGCEAGRQWCFMTFSNANEAQFAKDSCDRKLMFPGCTRACEVTIARNQGMFGQDPVLAAPNSAVGAGMLPATTSGYQDPMMMAASAGQPPPPVTPPPPHLTPWRQYKTVSGIPYYHNHTTGQTQWECPPDLQPQAQAGVRYSPY